MDDKSQNVSDPGSVMWKSGANVDTLHVLITYKYFKRNTKEKMGILKKWVMNIHEKGLNEKHVSHLQKIILANGKLVLKNNSEWLALTTKWRSLFWTKSFSAYLNIDLRTISHRSCAKVITPL